jgi:hypothetical protein
MTILEIGISFPTTGWLVRPLERREPVY